MSNVSNLRRIRPGNEAETPKDQPVVAHRIMFDLVPLHVVKEIFNAAIAVGIVAGNGGYTTESSEADEFLGGLTDAVEEASKYSVPVDFDTGEPI